MNRVGRLVAVLLAEYLCLAAYGDGPASIQEFVGEALRRNPTLQAARAEALGTRIQADREKPDARPTVLIEGTATVQGPRATFPRGVEEAIVLPTGYTRLGVTVEQPVYRTGWQAAWQRYHASRRTAQQTFLVAANTLIRDVRKACLAVVTARTIQQAAREGYDLAKAHLEMARQMVAAGTAAPRDVQSAEADLFEAEEGLIKAEDGTRLAEAGLNRLLARSLDAPIAIAQPLDEPGVPPDVDTAVGTALRCRPELALLRDQLQAARAATALAAAQNSPLVSLRASLVQQTPTAFTRSSWYALGLVLNWPVLDGGKATCDRREAEAAVARLSAMLRDSESGIRLEVQAAWASFRSARARIALCEKRQEAAESALEVSALRYEQRSATLLELSAARLALTQAQVAAIQARNDWLAAAFELRYACAMDLEQVPAL